jgi:transcriptional regulator GlxA family with amidase domain
VQRNPTGGAKGKGRASPSNGRVSRRQSPGRRIVAVVVPQVFSSVNRLAGRTIYTIEVATNTEHLAVDGEGGVLTFIARNHFNKIEGQCDSVLLVCGLASRSVCDPVLSSWLKKMSGEVRRLGAVCVGAFLLAEAGLLNGRRATSHWRFGRELATRYPEVQVEHDPLWVKDGNIYTCAGISAGIDLALA